MRISIDEKRAFALFDELVGRWMAKQYPYNRPDAIIPQNIIPEDIRRDKLTLARFYFYLCIYMRGGIESLQAFNALILMWRAHPVLFDPHYAQWLRHENVQELLKKFIGWDSKSASISWVENSKRLARNWSGNPLCLLKGLRDYDEAVCRIKNKTTKKELREAALGNEGFRGFQPKMVSMLIYFYDWEGWLEKRFLYPSPADFHNFRLGLGNEVIVVELAEGERLSANEKLSAPWRAVVMRYLKTRRADPLAVADALWLFSLVMCGNSPVTVTKQQNGGTPLFAHHGVEETFSHDQWVLHKGRKLLEQTCLVCPFTKTCAYAIPSRPYYRKGQLVLRLRSKIELKTNTAILREPLWSEVLLEPEVVQLIPHLEHPASA